MSSNPSLREFAKDLYRLLQLPRTATQIDIKRSYREMALTLHPDRHVQGSEISSSSSDDKGNNNFVDTQQQQQTTNNTAAAAAAEQARIRLTKERKTAQFKEVNEAYRILSDIALRREYDRWLDTVDITSDGHVYKRGTSRAAERNPFYRKVYSPAAPPGMKTFDRQRHYDMHYGDGMMKEEIERAMKRAEAASTRGSSSSSASSRFGYYYRSPLGKGFNFDPDRPMTEQRNPYSRRGVRQHDDINTDGGFRVIYEEAYVNMNSSGGGFDNNNAKSSSSSTTHRSTNIIIRSGKEYVVERMKERRETRLRERGDPNPYKTQRRHAGSSGGGGEGVKNDNAQQQQQQQQSLSGCVIM